MAGQIYQTSAAPEYYLGHGWSLACLVFAWCLWWVMRWLYQGREAAKHRAGEAPQAEEAQAPPPHALPGKGPSAEHDEEGGEACDDYTDRSASFKYII